MKKHLVAFLSMIGLAGSAAPSQAQVLKGAEPKSKAKTESQIKQSKQIAERNAANAQIQDKRKDTLRNQNTAAGQKNALTKAGLTKAALTKAKGAEQK